PPTAAASEATGDGRNSTRSSRWGRYPHEPGAEFRPRTLVSRCNHGPDRLRSPIGVAGGKWRIRIVFETELDRLGNISAGNLGGDVETKVDSRCDAAGGDPGS